MRKKLLIIICAVIGVMTLLSIGLIFASIEEEEVAEPAPAPVRTVSDVEYNRLLRDAIYVYKDTADPARALKELEEQSPADADVWMDIMKYWTETNTKAFVRMNTLPDNLPHDDSLCIVCLGFQLNPDGSMKDELIHRLETAKAAAEQYPEAYVLMTGGGTAAQNASATEADRMAEWLIENGVDKDRIIVENKSKTTTENAVFSERILSSEYPQVKAVAMVTCDYHIPLGCQLFNARFILKDAPARVVANAACSSGGTLPFDSDSQAYWMLNLVSYE